MTILLMILVALGAFIHFKSVFYKPKEKEIDKSDSAATSLLPIISLRDCNVLRRIDMFNWFLTKLTDHWEKKCKKEMGGIPLLWVIYHADKPVPNIDFRLHPMFSGDIFLNDQFKIIEEYMRIGYLEPKEGWHGQI